MNYILHHEHLKKFCIILKDKYKINIYLHGKYPHDPCGTTICQLRKFLEKLYENVNIFFDDKLPTDLQISFKIIKLLITQGNLNLIHNRTTYEHFNHLSRKKKIWTNDTMMCNH